MRASVVAATLAALLCGAAAPAQGALIPYTESFESLGWPGPEWTLTFSDPAVGRIQATTPTPASPDGGRAANFDVSTSSTFSTNELTLAINLAAAPAAVLKYWAKETSDEANVEDGLFLNDGVSTTWVKVVDHATLTASWIEITVNLAAVAAANGLAPTTNFKVRFSQRDNFPTPSDGLQIDGVRITVPVVGQANSAAAFLDLNGGLNASAQSAAIGVAGPFFANASPGELLAFDIMGAPAQPYILAAGPMNAGNAMFPGIGSLDLGMFGAGNLGDVAIVLDGTQPGILNGLARTDMTGHSALVFSMPPAPPGPWLAFQAGVFNGTALTLTAATQITVP